MSKEDNVVSFNTGLDVRSHREVLDFLAGIDVENSMAYLPMTIHDPNIDQEDYVEYLYGYVQDELDYLIAEIAASDPKLWKRAAESLREQMDKSKHLIRFVITLSSKNEETGAYESELHELVLVWDHHCERYVIIGYNYDHVPLVGIATHDYLFPEIEGLNEIPITEVRI